MIVAEQKPLPELYRMISPYERILILGCGTCMTVCDAGGEREVSFLHQALRLAQSRSIDIIPNCPGVDPAEPGYTFSESTRKLPSPVHVFLEYTLKRQCEPEFILQLKEKVEDLDAVLSLGCGIGVQAIAELFPDLPVLPGVNTFFMGIPRKQGVWDERCAACGECRLEDTGGICPITRCTKGILNGPCAGTKNGKCEANKDMDCAWVLIYRRLERLGQLEKIRRYYPLRNFRAIPRPKRLIRTPDKGGESHGKLVI